MQDGAMFYKNISTKPSTFNLQPSNFILCTIHRAENTDDEIRLKSIFEAKFSEALKTVGKKFDFIELYEARREFRDEILNIIGTDLNGYILDDCAID